jgi:hypothetical protein
MLAGIGGKTGAATSQLAGRCAIAKPDLAHFGAEHAFSGAV